MKKENVIKVTSSNNESVSSSQDGSVSNELVMAIQALIKQMRESGPLQSTYGDTT